MTVEEKISFVTGKKDPTYENLKIIKISPHSKSSFGVKYEKGHEDILSLQDIDDIYSSVIAVETKPKFETGRNVEVEKGYINTFSNETNPEKIPSRVVKIEGFFITNRDIEYKTVNKEGIELIIPEKAIRGYYVPYLEKDIESKASKKEVEELKELVGSLKKPSAPDRRYINFSDEEITNLISTYRQLIKIEIDGYSIEHYKDKIKELEKEQKERK